MFGEESGEVLTELRFIIATPNEGDCTALQFGFNGLSGSLDPFALARIADMVVKQNGVRAGFAIAERRIGSGRPLKFSSAVAGYFEHVFPSGRLFVIGAEQDEVMRGTSFVSATDEYMAASA